MELCNYPEGKLRIQKKGKYIQYYQRKNAGDGNGIYIPSSERHLIRSLAQRDYEEDLLQVIDKEIKAIDRSVLSLRKSEWDAKQLLYMEDLYGKLSPERRELVSPLVISDEEYVKQWKKYEYEGLPFDDEIKHLSRGGVRVRSKSEVMIADMLEEYGIPYRYECPLVLKGGIWVSPDFTCLRIKDRTEVIFEHFGMMDDPEYVAKTVRKIRNYTLSGYVFGKSFVFTMETGAKPLNVIEIEGLIKNHLV